MLSVLLWSLLTSAAWGAEEHGPVLPIGISGEQDFHPVQVMQLSNVTKAAIRVVRMFAPREIKNHLFNWTGARRLIKGKRIEIRFATGRSPWLQPLLAGASDSDAFTVASVDLKNRRMRIVIVLLVDRLLYDPSGKEHPDGFSRLVVALAHEIFGTVQDCLEDDFDTLKPQTAADKVKLELRSYRASLSFLRGLKKNPAFGRLPAEMQVGLLGRLPPEIKAYRTWLKAHPGESPDPACGEMLKSPAKP
jgi:hypothetical protein